MRQRVAALGGALLVVGCGIERPAEPEAADISLPPLADAIPYDALGSGRIVFSRAGPNRGEYHGIYVVDVDAERSWAFDPYWKQLARGGFIAWGAPEVSPDGARIAFWGGRWVYMVDIDGENMVCIWCDSHADHASPSWAPDGSQLCFWAGEVLYAQSPVPYPTDRRIVTSLDPTTFSISPFHVHGSVGPTGALVYAGGARYSDSVSVSGIFVIEPGASGPRPFIADTVLDPTSPGDVFTQLECPRWSPEGTRIAYLVTTSAYGASAVEDSLVIMVAASDGTPRTPLLRRVVPSESSRGEIKHSITWSPDGTRLLFNLPEGDFVSHLYVINADGSGLRAVTTAPGVSDRSPSWSR